MTNAAIQTLIAPPAHPTVEREDARIETLLAMLPEGTRSVLEIGARHGRMTRELANRVQHVTALDLSRPDFEIPRVTTIAGNVQCLQFETNSFDCVVCTEVLEHVTDLAAAARELARVSRRHLLVGVPYRQDTRVGRTTCNHCGTINPPWGHIHTFHDRGLSRLFSKLRTVKTQCCAENRERTNALSTLLQDFARNPYGVYEQEEGCIACGKKMIAPEDLSFVERAACALGVRLYNVQTRFNKPRPTWIHLLMAKG